MILPSCGNALKSTPDSQRRIILQILLAPAAFAGSDRARTEFEPTVWLLARLAFQLLELLPPPLPADMREHSDQDGQQALLALEVRPYVRFHERRQGEETARRYIHEALPGPEVFDQFS